MIPFGIRVIQIDLPGDEDDDRRVKPFPTPSEVKFETGFGATVQDLKRGYLEIDLDDPETIDRGLRS